MSDPKDPEAWESFCADVEEALDWTPSYGEQSAMQYYLVYQMGALQQLKKSSEKQLAMMDEVSEIISRNAP